MAEVIHYRFRMRRALAATWTSANEILLEGEYGYEKDTGKVKIGDGVTPWNELPYGPNIYDAVKAMLVAGANVTITPDDELGTLTIAATGGGGGSSDYRDFWLFG